jgi:hypothetical protein
MTDKNLLTDDEIKDACDAIDFGTMVTADDYIYVIARAIEQAVLSRLPAASNADDAVTVLPDGSAFAVASYPLPKDHWLYADREYEPGADEPKELPTPILTHDHHDVVVAAVRYAVRGATMCGKESDFDPDALVQNAVYALCGPFTRNPVLPAAANALKDAIVHGTGVMVGDRHVPIDQVMKPATVAQGDERDGWVRVEDRLPEKDVPVLVFTPGNDNLKFHIDEWTTYRESPVSWSTVTVETGEGWGDHEFEEVTHWRPLNEPARAAMSTQGGGDA